MKTSILRAQAAIVGGGAAGCRAAVRLAQKGYGCLLVEKAFIKRSGCLAAGINALNAYVGRGRRPSDYADYAFRDAHEVADKKLLLTMSERLSEEVDWLESIGLTVQTDQRGRRLERGWRNLRVNGEPIKPLMAAAVRREAKVKVLEELYAVSLIGDGRRCHGLLALSLSSGDLVRIEAPAVIMATGGAAGLYPSQNLPGAKNRIWYSPFNTGAGLSMGIEAGAEMTTLEMRMVALRCRGTLAPTGTLALGAGASQVNSLGERYEDSYGRTTSQRVLALRREMAAGRGPCFLSFKASKEAMEGLCRAYLDMSPTQALKWLESEESFGAEARAELEASEPYVMGGHTGGGFKIDQGRRASLEGLFAAGDAAGGCPQKFATGSMAEGAMAAESVASYLAGRPALPSPEEMGRLSEKAIESIAAHLGEPKKGAKTAGELESGLLSLMDQKAGGAWAGYAYDLGGLGQALLELKELKLEAQKLRAKTPRGLSGIIELSRRLTLSESLVRHLRAREETRWPGFGEFKSFPGLSSGPPYEVVSALSPSGIETFRRPLSEGG